MATDDCCPRCGEEEGFEAWRGARWKDHGIERCIEYQRDQIQSLKDRVEALKDQVTGLLDREEW